jgi:hypothetical protein
MVGAVVVQWVGKKVRFFSFKKIFMLFLIELTRGPSPPQQIMPHQPWRVGPAVSLSINSLPILF